MKQVKPKKNLGQHFLIDLGIARRIADTVDACPDLPVLEIGPGIGTLTQALCEAAGRVVAVEIDKDMIPILEENLSYYDNYEIINDDVLRVDLKRLIEERDPSGRRIKVAANLPYYITTPIIMQLLESRMPISSITVMVQKEVADRMQAAPGTSDYGALSLAVQYYAEAAINSKVPPNCFIPRPGVDSAVITLNCYEEPPVDVKDDRYMFRLIKAAFAQRRKTLVNALKNDTGLKLTREKVEAAIDELGLDINIRGERLSLEQFARLSDILGAG